MKCRDVCVALICAGFFCVDASAAPVLLTQFRSMQAEVDGADPAVAESTEAGRFPATGFDEPVTSSHMGSEATVRHDSIIDPAQMIADILVETSAAAEGPTARGHSLYSTTFRLDAPHAFDLFLDFARLIGPGEDAAYKAKLSGGEFELEREGSELFQTSGRLEAGEYEFSFEASHHDTEALSRVRYGAQLDLREIPGSEPEPAPIPLPPAAWAGAMTLGATWLMGAVRRRRQNAA